jgi:hypothetical protein
VIQRIFGMKEAKDEERRPQDREMRGARKEAALPRPLAGKPKKENNALHEMFQFGRGVH